MGPFSIALLLSVARIQRFEDQVCHQHLGPSGMGEEALACCWAPKTPFLHGVGVYAYMLVYYECEYMQYCVFMCDCVYVVLHLYSNVYTCLYSLGGLSIWGYV